VVFLVGLRVPLLRLPEVLLVLSLWVLSLPLGLVLHPLGCFEGVRVRLIALMGILLRGLA
jgi:hypothetical protein